MDNVKTLLAGIDIGGTKCAVSLGEAYDGGIRLRGKRRFPTEGDAQTVLRTLGDALADMLVEVEAGPGEPGERKLQAIGISCGGPLDSRRGVILSPPNLPGWDRVEAASYFSRRFGVPAALQNDANACALAEWKWGAGRGRSNVIFLTFGTGMGAGLILNGRLYSGANDMAGEIGHIRLEEDGPVGYGKAGSFEGFCSGGGIAQLAQTIAQDAIRRGQPPAFCPTEAELSSITAETVGEAASRGDELAVHIYTIVGRQLGRGLAVLIDLLNPERIIIGSIFGRQRAILEPVMLEGIRREALPLSAAVCDIVPAGLGEHIGDYASLSIAADVLEDKS